MKRKNHEGRAQPAAVFAAEAFEALWAENEGHVRAVIRRHRHLAPAGCDAGIFMEEALSRAAIKLWRGAAGARGTQSWLGWLRRLARSAVIDQWRRERAWYARRDTAGIADATGGGERWASPLEGPDRGLVRGEGEVRLRSALARLAEEGAERRTWALATEMRHLEGADIRTIADRMGVTERTVHRYLIKAMARLHALLRNGRGPPRHAPGGRRSPACQIAASACVFIHDGLGSCEPPPKPLDEGDHPMSKTNTLATAAILLAAVAGPAVAAPMKRGDHELTLTGALNATPDFRFFSVDASLGYLLTDRHEVGAILRYSHYSDDYGASSGGSLGAFYHYNFAARGNLVPFAGGGAAFGFGGANGVAGGSVVLSDPSAFAEVGVKWFIGKGAQVRIEYVGEHYFGDSSLTSNGIVAGIALVF